MDQIKIGKFIQDKRKEKNLLKIIRIKHPGAKDIHRIISSNDSEYKDDFMRVYSCKCAYCGISIDLISRTNFEVDHFICATSKRFPSKSDAGYIDNLVLACHDCNHDKGSFEISDEKFNDLFPDGEGIKKTFIRDSDYYIKISQEKEKDKLINDFYNKLNLGSEIHRIDYLLMNMLEMKSCLSEQPEALLDLLESIELLRTKRHLTHRRSR